MFFKIANSGTFFLLLGFWEHFSKFCLKSFNSQLPHVCQQQQKNHFLKQKAFLLEAFFFVRSNFRKKTLHLKHVLKMLRIMLKKHNSEGFDLVELFGVFSLLQSLVTESFVLKLSVN